MIDKVGRDHFTVLFRQLVDSIYVLTNEVKKISDSLDRIEKKIKVRDKDKEKGDKQKKDLQV